MGDLASGADSPANLEGINPDEVEPRPLTGRVTPRNLVDLHRESEGVPSALRLSKSETSPKSRPRRLLKYPAPLADRRDRRFAERLLVVAVAK
jgi:hypothetical protein